MLELPTKNLYQLVVFANSCGCRRPGLGPRHVTGIPSGWTVEGLGGSTERRPAASDRNEVGDVLEEQLEAS